MRAGFALLLSCVIAAGASAIAWETDGFRVITSEGARRIEIERAPRPLPAISLIDQDGTAFSLADYRGRVVLVEFIYTSCPVVCGLLGEQFRAVQTLIRDDRTAGRIALLSISFDVGHDGPPELKAYGARFGAAPPLWRIAVPTARDVPALLGAFGVVVIPDGYGGFDHNAAISVVDAEGRFVRVLDPAPAPLLLTQLAAPAPQ